jgi:ankyrin repeat protein
LTPLSLAVILNRSEMVLDILTAGADVNFVNEEGWVISLQYEVDIKAAIHYAVAMCEGGNTFILSILLQHKANINIATKKGRNNW